METNNLERIKKILRERVLVLDGAMGTMIQRHALEEEDFRNEVLKDHSHPLKGNNDLLSITRPDIILDIHRQFFEAGADIAETNTFSGNTISQEDYELAHMVREINIQGTKLARQAADEFTKANPDKPRFVAGSMGPTTKLASMSPDVNNPAMRATHFDELAIAFKEQANALLDGGADILMIETVTDTLNAKAALFAIQEVIEERGPIPIMISGTITDQSGRILSGQTTEAFYISLNHVPLLSIGLNCALGADLLKPYVASLAKIADAPTSAHPNAGLPNEFGQYDQSPEDLGKLIKKYLDDELLNIIGGCCGTTPEHIKVIAELAKNGKPREFQ